MAGRRVVLQDPHPDRRGRIVQADGQKAPPVVEDHCQIARLPGSALRDDGAVEQPGVALAQGALRVGCHPQRETTVRRERE